MTDDFDDVDFDADDGELGFVPAVSATGADNSSAAPQRRRRGALLAAGARCRAGAGASPALVDRCSWRSPRWAACTGCSRQSSGGHRHRSGPGPDRQRPPAVQHQLRHLPRRQPAGRHRPRPVPDRRRLGRDLLPGQHRPDAGHRPGAPSRPAKTNKFTEAQTEAIAAYVQSMGGGVQIPDGSLAGDSATLAEGGELFRLNCASCHGSTGKGAPLSAGKSAPGLNDASAKQIYAAMLSGPESMPVFNDNQLTPDAEAGRRRLRPDPAEDARTRAVNGIDRIGPVSEGIVLWVLGVGGARPGDLVDRGEGMTTTQHDSDADRRRRTATTPHGDAVVPDIDELLTMTTEEQMIIGAASQGRAHRAPAQPLPDPRHEGREAGRAGGVGVLHHRRAGRASASSSPSSRCPITGTCPARARTSSTTRPSSARCSA